MELPSMLSATDPIAAPTLADAISRLSAEFTNMKSSLREANREIARLRGELARRGKRPRSLSSEDVGALRRRVAYHCHPDRGGDADLMSRLNTLFDYLEGLDHQRQGAAR